MKSKNFARLGGPRKKPKKQKRNGKKQKRNAKKRYKKRGRETWSRNVVERCKTTLKTRSHHGAQFAVAVSEGLVGPIFYERVFSNSNSQEVPGSFAVS
jgi:hypothetical protein